MSQEQENAISPVINLNSKLFFQLEPVFFHCISGFAYPGDGCFSLGSTFKCYCRSSESKHTHVSHHHYSQDACNTMSFARAALNDSAELSLPHCADQVSTKNYTSGTNRVLL